jgi:hypothetical protein
MRVEAAKQATSGKTGGTPRDATLAPAEHHTGSRELVALTPTFTPAPPMGYRQAAFLAHLIAVKDQHPQTRERRRAEPGEAIAAYRAGQALVA